MFRISWKIKQMVVQCQNSLNTNLEYHSWGDSVVSEHLVECQNPLELCTVAIITLTSVICQWFYSYV